jgi:hypothetical protein
MNAFVSVDFRAQISNECHAGRRPSRSSRGPILNIAPGDRLGARFFVRFAGTFETNQ